MIALARMSVGAATLVVLLSSGRRDATLRPASAVRPPGSAPAALKRAGGGMPPGGVRGPIYQRESSGIDPLGGGVHVRYDAAGNPVSVYLSRSIIQMRTGWLTTRPEAGVTSSQRKIPSRAFAWFSLDPGNIKPASFENSDAPWIVLRMPRSTPVDASHVVTGSLHANGLKKPGRDTYFRF
jgi:hypothetical protein